MSRKAQTVIQQGEDVEGVFNVWTDFKIVLGNTADAIKMLRDDGTPGEFRIIAVKKHVTVEKATTVKVQVS